MQNTVDIKKLDEFCEMSNVHMDVSFKYFLRVNPGESVQNRLHETIEIEIFG